MNFPFGSYLQLLNKPAKESPITRNVEPKNKFSVYFELINHKLYLIIDHKNGQEKLFAPQLYSELVNKEMKKTDSYRSFSSKTTNRTIGIKESGNYFKYTNRIDFFEKKAQKMNNWHNSICDHCSNSWICTGCTKLQDKFSNLCKNNFYSCLNEQKTTENFESELALFHNNLQGLNKKIEQNKKHLKDMKLEYTKINNEITKETHKNDETILLNNKNQIKMLKYTKKLLGKTKEETNNNSINILCDKITKSYDKIIKDLNNDIENLTNFYNYDNKLINLNILKTKSLYTYNVVKKQLELEKNNQMTKQIDSNISTIRTEIVQAVDILSNNSSTLFDCDVETINKFVLDNYGKYDKKKWFFFSVDESFYMALIVKNIPAKILQFDELFFEDYSLEIKQYLIYVIYILCNHFNSTILLKVINKFTKSVNKETKIDNICDNIKKEEISFKIDDGNNDEYVDDSNVTNPVVVKSKKIRFCEKIFDNFGKIFNFTIEDVGNPEKEKIMVRCFMMLHDQMCILNKNKSCSYTFKNMINYINTIKNIKKTKK